MNGKSLVMIGIFVVLGVVVIGLHNSKAIIGKDDVIKIGAIFPLTGNVSDVGLHLRDGMALGSQQFFSNAEVLYEDSKALPQIGYSAFQKILLTNHPKFIFSAISGVALAIRDIAEQKKILHFSMVGSPELITDNAKYTYRFFPSTDYVGLEISRWVVQKKIKKIAILYANNEWGLSYKKSLSKNLENTGVRVAYISAVEERRDMYRDIASRIVDGDVECVCISMQGSNYSEMVNRVRETGYNGIIVCDNNFTAAIAEKCGNVLDNVMVLDFQKPENEKYEAFKSVYTTKYGKRPDMPAILAYEMIGMIAFVEEKFGGNAWYDAKLLQDVAYEGMLGRIVVSGREVCFPLVLKKAIDLLP